MDSQHAMIVAPLVCQAVLATWLGVVAWRRRPAAGAPALALLLFCIAWSLVANVLEKSATSPWSTLLWSNVEYLGYAGLPIAWLMFGLDYLGMRAWLQPRRIAWLLIVPALAIIAVFTNPWHGLFYSRVEFETVGSLLVFRPTYGPLFYVHLCYSYVAVAVGMILVSAVVVHGPSLYRRQSLCLLAGMLVPWLANMVHVSRLVTLTFDPTIFSAAAMIAGSMGALFVYRGLDLAPIPEEWVLRSMPDGLVVLDRLGRVAQANAAALRVLGGLGARPMVIGDRIDDLLPLPREFWDTPCDRSELVDAPLEISGQTRHFEIGLVPVAGEKSSARLMLIRDVTDRVAAQTGQRESEARFSAAFDSFPRELLMYDASGAFTHQNAVSARAWGNLVGKRPETTGLDPELMVQWREGCRRALRGEITQRRMTAIREGEPTTFDTVFAPVDDRGKIVGGLAVFIDVTEQVRALARLAQSEERRAEVQRIARVGRWEWRPQEETVTLSEEFFRILGLELPSQPFGLERLIASIAPDDRPSVREALGEAVRLRRLSPFVCRVVQPAGRTRYIEMQGAWSGDPGGGLVGVAQDITDRKLAELAAIENEAKYRALMEQASDGIFVSDLDGRFVDVNTRAARMLGLERSQLIGMTIHDVIAPEDIERRPLRLDELRAGKSMLIERVLRRADGVRVPVEINANKLNDDNLQAIARDISDRKKAEEERKRFDEQLQLAQKLESLGILAGGIAHDFNNLLVGVLGNAGLALMELEADAPLRRHLECISTAAIRASDLCRQMLAYSGRGATLFEPIDLSSLVREMINLLKVSISKRVTLECDLADGLAAIMGDPTQIRQIVMNLVTNASEAIGERVGRITVRVRMEDVDERILARSYVNDGLPPGRYLCLEVRDNGVGMDQEIQSRIFDPFFTTKFTGRGLGLAAVLGIVRSHKGAIRVESELERGARFRVYLPANAVSPSINTGPPLDPPMERASGSILVIDDESHVRLFATEALKRFGFSVLQATDGPEGIELFRAHEHEIAAVLLDATMPLMSGEETFQALMEIRSDTPVILSSGFNETEATDRFVGQGLAGFLQKPYGPGELIRAIRQVIGGHAVSTSEPR